MNLNFRGFCRCCLFVLLVIFPSLVFYTESVSKHKTRSAIAIEQSSPVNPPCTLSTSCRTSITYYHNTDPPEMGIKLIPLIQGDVESRQMLPPDQTVGGIYTCRTREVGVQRPQWRREGIFAAWVAPWRKKRRAVPVSHVGGGGGGGVADVKPNPSRQATSIAKFKGGDH